MNTLALAALSLTLMAGAASASSTVPPVNVLAGSAANLTLSCAAPRATDTEVRQVLSVLDSSDLPSLRLALHRAASEACDAKVARIVVNRRGSQVDWAPALSTDGAVAIVLR